jgi:hypothetical protein
MTWTAAGYALSRTSLVDDVAQIHCARVGRPDDAGGILQLAGSVTLATAMAAVDFVLAGWKTRRFSDADGVGVMLAPFAYPAYRGIAAYGVGLRIVF